MKYIFYIFLNLNDGLNYKNYLNKNKTYNEKDLVNLRDKKYLQYKIFFSKNYISRVFEILPKSGKYYIQIRRYTRKVLLMVGKKSIKLLISVHVYT